jgi:hypothetical protein
LLRRTTTNTWIVLYVPLCVANAPSRAGFYLPKTARAVDIATLLHGPLRVDGRARVKLPPGLKHAGQTVTGG